MSKKAWETLIEDIQNNVSDYDLIYSVSNTMWVVLQVPVIPQDFPSNPAMYVFIVTPIFQKRKIRSITVLKFL